MSDPTPEVTLSASPSTSVFEALFSRLALRVRARLVLRSVLGWSSAGALLSACAGAAAWVLHRPMLVPVGASIAAISAAIGFVSALRRRWNDQEIALYLDGRLGSDEVLSTALALTSGQHTAPATGKLVVAQAERVLRSADPQRVRLRVLRRSHGLLPLGLAALVVFARLSTPSIATAREAGLRTVRADDVEGLELIEHLRDLPARDRPQRERLDRIAEDARRLREQLREGMFQRDALDRLARLRERVAAEQLQPNAQQERRGIEAAMARLTRAGLTEAARAVGDQDPEQLDRTMEREANRQERQDRERARQALQEAAEAARREGAHETARTLEEQERRLRQRGDRSDALRALAREVAQDPGVSRALERLNRERTDGAAGALGRALEQALARLTPEQRRALVERMRQEARAPQNSSQMGSQSGSQGSQSNPSANELLQGILNWLDPANQGQRPQSGSQGQPGDGGAGSGDGGAQGSQGSSGPITRLSLSQAAGGPGSLSSGATQSGLRDAQAGAQSASQQLSGAQGSQGGQGQNGQGQGQGQGSQGQNGQGGQGQNGQGQGGNNNGQGTSEGQGGPSGGGASGAHGGGANAVQGGQTIRSHANTQIQGGETMAAGQQGFAPGRAGATANIRGTGDLNTVAPAELRAVEGSAVPAEYREHVRQYFQP